MAFENSNGEYTFNALSYKANNRQGEMCLFSPVKLSVRIESEVAELAGQTDSPPFHQRQHDFQLQFQQDSAILCILNFQLAKISMFIEPGNLIQSM